MDTLNIEANKEHQIIHQYFVKNDGPSPVKSAIRFLVPIVKIKDKDVFEVSVQDESLQKCIPAADTLRSNIPYDGTSVILTAEDRAVAVDCFQDWECIEFRCEEKILRKQMEPSSYTVIVNTKSDLLDAFLRDNSKTKDIIAYVSTAFTYDRSLIIDNHVVTLIYFKINNMVPIWVYIVATVVGCSILALLILLLFKCNFFERSYRDKLLEERHLVNTMKKQSEEHMGDQSEDLVSPLEIVDEEEEAEE